MKKPAYQTKVVLGDALRRHIEASARAHRTGVAEEIRRRLEQTIDEESDAHDALVRDIRLLARELGVFSDPQWGVYYAAFAAGLKILLEHHRPEIKSGGSKVAPEVYESLIEEGKAIARMLIRRRQPKGGKS